MLTVPLRLLVLDSEQSPSALFKSLQEALRALDDETGRNAAKIC
jgi:hypothetical protein